ncbi:NADPH-dependent FMN reductase [Oceanobacter mangrovi]|uniref:NADPH-dependent FMN reductase n=1 Tax=Oceanobacter mangrovi TaxID=2862510 RepID=UPI001C8E19F3|nr:NAD(P)H-dependent oxidoreductase [Oceanobacter mangrovi]
MKFLIFLGSVRDSTPPRPARLGARLVQACLTCLQVNYGDHQFEVIDPLDYPLEPVFKPHFAYSSRQVPEPLQRLADKIAAADGYVMVSPEYNHSMSPALANLLNHFGSSLFAFKPSAIVTYSAGQWGGMRAAVGMRTFLSELGCLPVSAMIHVPKVQDVFDEQGEPLAGVELADWQAYFGRTFNQLLWWADATAKQRAAVDPHQAIGHFQRSADQRNAPG